MGNRPGGYIGAQAASGGVFDLTSLLSGGSMRARQIPIISSGSALTARYVRFTNVLIPTGTNALDISELRFLDEGGGGISAPTFTRVNPPGEAAFSSSTFSNSVLNDRAGYWGGSGGALAASFYLQADFGSVQNVSAWWQACYSTSAGSTSTAAPNASNESIGRWMRGATITYSVNGSSYATAGTFFFSNPGIGSRGPDESFILFEPPVFGDSVRGEVAQWRDIFYGCIASGNPGTWVPLLLGDPILPPP